jgi:S1-C subfamily serine protease
VIAPRAASPERIGPGFDCTKAATPLTFLICGDAELSRLDLRFNQVYWALFQQIGPSAQPQLKEEDIEFIDQVQDQCGLPKAGTFTAELSRSRDCIKDAYGRKRAEWLSRLVGEAREEALRAPEDHLALQQALQQIGFLSPGPVDGLYARGTRSAIVGWQTIRGRAVTGFLGDTDARAILREISAGSQAVPQGDQRSQTGLSGSGGSERGPEPKAPLPQVASREEPKPPVAEPRRVAVGSAFVINKVGELLTNHHVVKSCALVRVRVGEVQQDAVVAFTDDRNDLAVVRTRGMGIEPLRFREGKPIRPADAVVALGFPYAGLLATSPQVTTGTVSALAGLHDDSRILQLTAPIQPGNSGGPLLDLSGNVVGVVYSQINELAVAEATGSLPQNINFAIKVGIIREFLDAHRVDYSVSQSTSKLEPADVGETATKSTVLLECYR